MKESVTEIKKTFTKQDQLAFAKLSGDFNPLHINPIYARRMMTGQVVVHGISAVLWALNIFAGQYKKPFCLEEIDVTFSKPIPIGQELVFKIKNKNNQKISIEVLHDNNSLALINVTIAKFSNSLSIKHIIYKKKAPNELSIGNIENNSGNIQLGFNQKILEEMFFELSKYICHVDLAALLATTKLVGMVCPGLNSLYHELYLKREADKLNKLLFYKVKKVDKRFNLVDLDVETPNLIGNIKAFLRPPPKRQENFSNIASKVNKNEFSGQKALIIGGSRGLGELMAKILSAGGAAVFITYNLGKKEAEALVDEIKSKKGQIAAFEFDVLNPCKQNKINPTHIYYMATPFIFSGNRGNFSSSLFNNFSNYYISGFYKTIKIFLNNELKSIFFPSSIAVEKTPLDMMEYATAKAAGEKVCSLIKEQFPNITTFYFRLPRLSTDQTISLIPTKNPDAFPLILNILRDLR